ncbi:DUF3093 domain-containing protein [Jatrophihabitans sp. DSM 45814]
MTAQPSSIPGTIAYTERLYSPWWWYPAAVAVAVLLGAEFALAFTAWWAWLPTVALVAICVLVVWRLSAGRVTVTGTHVSAGDQSVELGAITAAIGVSSGELRRLVGRHGDPLAFNFIRSWVGPGVQFVLREGQSEDGESADPYSVPYWLVSSRHPDRLLAALHAASVPIR